MVQPCNNLGHRLYERECTPVFITVALRLLVNPVVITKREKTTPMHDGMQIHFTNSRIGTDWVKPVANVPRRLCGQKKLTASFVTLLCITALFDADFPKLHILLSFHYSTNCGIVSSKGLFYFFLRVCA